MKIQESRREADFLIFLADGSKSQLALELNQKRLKSWLLSSTGANNGVGWWCEMMMGVITWQHFCWLSIIVTSKPAEQQWVVLQFQ